MKHILALAIFCGSLWAASSAAVDPINKNGDGHAVKGYDVVAYFTDSRPVKGDPQFSHQWMGATWLFASAAHRDQFKENPAQYAPQYGGYCAYAVSRNYTADIHPPNWKVVNGKLYLNHRFAKGRWESDVPGNIAKGDANWPNIPKK